MRNSQKLVVPNRCKLQRGSPDEHITCTAHCNPKPLAFSNLFLVVVIRK